MAWVSPTGHNDPSSNWVNEEKAYDNNIETHARADNYSTSYIELNHPAIQCDKVRIHCYKWKSSGNGNPDILLDIYYDEAWHNIFDGAVTKEIWVEKEIGSTQSITASRICCNSYKGYQIFYINEFEFNQVSVGLINGYFMQDGTKEEKFGYYMNSIEEFGYYMNSLV